MQPKFVEVQIARIAAVFQRSKLQMDAVCKLEFELQNGVGVRVTKRWEPLFEYNHDRYFFYNRFRRNPDEFLANRLLDIGRYTNGLYFYKENLPELRKQFQFHDEILEAAQNALTLAKANFQSNTRNLVFVGIHCRWKEFQTHPLGIAGERTCCQNTTGLQRVTPGLMASSTTRQWPCTGILTCLSRLADKLPLDNCQEDKYQALHLSAWHLSALVLVLLAHIMWSGTCPVTKTSNYVVWQFILNTSIHNTNVNS